MYAILSWCPGDPCDPCVTDCKAWATTLDSARSTSAPDGTGFWNLWFNAHVTRETLLCPPIFVIPSGAFSVNWPDAPPGYDTPTQTNVKVSYNFGATHNEQPVGTTPIYFGVTRGGSIPAPTFTYNGPLFDNTGNLTIGVNFNFLAGYFGSIPSTSSSFVINA